MIGTCKVSESEVTLKILTQFLRGKKLNTVTVRETKFLLNPSDILIFFFISLVLLSNQDNFLQHKQLFSENPLASLMNKV